MPAAGTLDKALVGVTACQQGTEWTRQSLKRAVEQLQRQVGGPHDHVVVAEIVNLGMQPDILNALRHRTDPEEAVKDLATRYAFASLMAGESGSLEPLAQAMVERALDLIHQHAALIACRTGADPLDETPELLLTLSKNLSRYVPCKPMRVHIRWKLHHYESAVSRAMRQIENLVKHPEVVEAFIAYVLDADAPDALKAHLLQMAQGGGRYGVDYEAVIHFFAQAETVAFVKRFACSVETARTLYDEAEYDGFVWQGRRSLRTNRRQGYLDAALAHYRRQEDESLEDSVSACDGDTLGLHESIPDPDAGQHETSFHTHSFEAWATEQALDARPDDPLWQASRWLYIDKLSPMTIVARGLADPSTVSAAQRQMMALRANKAAWEAWMERTLRA